MWKRTSVFLITALASGCKDKRPPNIYEIPADFRGWVEIEYQRRDCLPLERRDGGLVIVIGRDGKACTSDAQHFGWALDRYYFGGKERAAGELNRAGSTGIEESGGKRRYYEKFFAGTEDELEASAR